MIGEAQNQIHTQTQKGGFSVLLIRHAQSEQNKRKKQLINKLGIQDFDVKPESHPEYFQMTYNPQLIDAQLSQLGVQQAYEAKEIMKNQDIDVVVVSPLRRALQTCEIIFGQKNNVKIFVQPLLTQGYHAACDIGGQIHHSLAKYKNKFSFHKLSEEQWSTWYVDQLQNEKIKQQILEKKTKQKNQNSQQFHLHSLQVLKKHRSFQSGYQLFKRCEKLKQQLQKYQKKSSKKMAIVGHYFLIKNLTCQKYNESFQPINGLKLWNAQVKQHRFNYK